jgi:hypothetical protein
MRRSEFPYPNDSGKGWLTRIEITIKKNVLPPSAYLLRAQLVMPFRNAMVARRRQFPTGYCCFVRRDIVQERNSGTGVCKG